MDALIDFVLVGVLAIILVFATAPLVLEFYYDAINATETEEGDESGVISAALLLVLFGFYFVTVYALYKAGMKHVDKQ